MMAPSVLCAGISDKGTGQALRTNSEGLRWARRGFTLHARDVLRLYSAGTPYRAVTGLVPCASTGGGMWWF